MKGSVEMKKLLNVLVLVSALLMFSSAVFASGSAENGTVLADIRERGRLIVGTEAQYAPYEFRDLDNNIVGCDIFIAEQIAEDLGVDLEIVDMAFDGIIPAIQSGQVDIGIAAFTSTPEREEVVDFSAVYEASQQYLVVAAGNEDVYTTPESLAGLKVGAQRGSIQSGLVRDVIPEAELFELGKYPELAIEVQNGNIAGFVVEGAVGESMVSSSEGKLAIANITFGDQLATVGKQAVLPKNNPDFLAEVNKVIERIVADGSYKKANHEAVTLQQELGF